MIIAMNKLDQLNGNYHLIEVNESFKKVNVKL
jgi:hypothetical protein